MKFREFIQRKLLGRYISRLIKKDDLDKYCALSLLLEESREMLFNGEVEESLIDNKFFDTVLCKQLIDSYEFGWNNVVKFTLENR